MLEAEQDVNIWSNLVKNKKVALIGPANYLQKFSQEFKDENLNRINDCDTIIRLNCIFNILEEYKHLLGSRTEIMYNSLLDNCNNGGVLEVDKIVNNNIKHIRTTPKSSVKGIANSNLRNFQHKTNEKLINLESNHNITVSTFDHRPFSRLAQAIDCRPTTGFAAIFDILLTEPKNLYVTGFSFFLSAPLQGYWGASKKGGIEEVFGRTEEEEALRGFNSTRHVHKNMWELLKNNKKVFTNLYFDQFLQEIINLEDYSKGRYNKILEEQLKK